jgi:protein ImuB
MAERLGNLDAGFGIDVATLEASRLAPLGPRQIALHETTAVDATVLVDRLAGRLGHARVRFWTACASHIPERAEAWRPAMEGEPVKLSPPSRDECGGETGATPAGSARRPPLLLSPPEPISVMAELPEGAPQRFVWRRLARRIVRSEGPERVAPEWWRHIGAPGPPPGTRDYYRLEDTTGARYWVFREGLYGRAEESPEAEAAESDGVAAGMPRWFVHGLFT